MRWPWESEVVGQAVCRVTVIKTMPDMHIQAASDHRGLDEKLDVLLPHLIEVLSMVRPRLCQYIPDCHFAARHSAARSVRRLLDQRSSWLPWRLALRDVAGSSVKSSICRTVVLRRFKKKFVFGFCASDEARARPSIFSMLGLLCKTSAG